MNCPLCRLRVEGWETRCSCGWLRVTTCVGCTSYLAEGRREEYRWVAVPAGCLLALGDGPGSSEEGPEADREGG